MKIDSYVIFSYLLPVIAVFKILKDSLNKTEFIIIQFNPLFFTPLIYVFCASGMFRHCPILLTLAVGILLEN